MNKLNICRIFILEKFKKAVYLKQNFVGCWQLYLGCLFDFAEDLNWCPIAVVAELFKKKIKIQSF